MKKLHSILLAMLLIAVACTPNIPVASITLDKTSLTIEAGDNLTLVVTILPENASEKSVKWESSDNSVLSVDAHGLISAQSAGTSIVTATAVDNGLKANCTVTVVNKEVPVTGVSLSPESLTMNAGETYALVATVLPENATDKSLTWETSSIFVASVSDGIVTAGRAGNATISVTTHDGGKTAKCEVSVNSFKEAITGSASDITCIRATISGQLVSNEDLSNYNYPRGVLYSTSPDVLYSTSIKAIPESYDDEEYHFSVILKNLVPGVKYYYRSFLTSSYVAKDDEVAYGEIKSFNALPLPGGAVNLGLSVKWASCNKGALRPEDYGDYIVFPSGIGTWRAPSLEEIHELLDNTTKRKVYINGVAGVLFVSTKEGYTDIPIFLPSAGERASDGVTMMYVGYRGRYWSHTVDNLRKDKGYFLSFDATSEYVPNVGITSQYIGSGFTIREVTQ